MLPEGKPGCLADFIRYYHDHADGVCKEIAYDGCNKNENNFETKEECEKICGPWHEAHKGHDHGQLKSSGDCAHGHDHDHDHNHDHSHHHH